MNRFHEQGCHINCLDSSCPCDNKCTCSRSGEDSYTLQEQISFKLIEQRDNYLARCHGIGMSSDKAMGILLAVEYFVGDTPEAKEKAYKIATDIAMDVGTDSRGKISGEDVK